MLLLAHVQLTLSSNSTERNRVLMWLRGAHGPQIRCTQGKDTLSAEYTTTSKYVLYKLILLASISLVKRITFYLCSYYVSLSVHVRHMDVILCVSDNITLCSHMEEAEIETC
jgi:hypothetical protein